jgi:P4 family phage/plasmid primase-like protien
MTTQTPPPIASRAEIEHAYDLIHGGNPTELRVPDMPNNGTGSGTFSDREKLVNTALNVSACKVPGVFWTIQKLKPAKFTNTWAWQVRSTTKDDGIEAYRWLPIDCDPAREPGHSATDAEKAKALGVAEEIRGFLNIHALNYVFADSGNGYHILIPIDVANKKENTTLINQILHALDLRFGTNEVAIDGRVSNPGRILKAYGTVVRKGLHTEERPHRRSGIIRGSEVQARLDIAQLDSLLVSIREGLTPEQQTETTSTACGSKEAASDEAVEFSLSEVKEFLKWAGLNYIQEKVAGDLRILVMQCIYDHKSRTHTKKEAWVGVNECAQKRFKCQHDTCRDKKWHDFRAEVEKRMGKRFKFAAPPEDKNSYDYSEKKLALLSDSTTDSVRSNLLRNGTIDAVTPEFVLTDALGNYLKFESRAAAELALREDLAIEFEGDAELIEASFKAVNWETNSSVLVMTSEDNIPLTERGNALRLLKERGRVLRYVPGTGWMGRSRSFWFVDVAKSNIREEMDQVLQRADFKGAPKAVAAWRRVCQSSRNLNASIEIANALPQFRTVLSEFDSDILMCNLKNCVLRFDRNTGAMSVAKHSLDDMTTFAMPADYDPKATCEQFEDFLKWMLPSEEQRVYVQTYVGLCLTGLKTRAFLTFVGVGRNGKTVLNKVLAGLFGPVIENKRKSNPYYVTCKMSTLTAVDEKGGGPRPDLVRLDAARVIALAESNQSSAKHVVKLNMAFLKNWTGDDPASPERGLYEAKMGDCRSHGKFFIFTNNLPEISENTAAAWERIKVIDCNSVVDPAKEDPQLHEKLLTERTGILNWALRGLAMYFANGQTIPTPASMKRRVEEYRVDDDPVRHFLQDQCREPGARDVNGTVIWTRAKILHLSFEKWYEDEIGICYMKITEFTKRIQEARGIKSERRKDGKYLPVALIDPPKGEEGQPLYEFGAAVDDAKAQSYMQ